MEVFNALRTEGKAHLSVPIESVLVSTPVYIEIQCCPLAAAAEANLGAVKMARVELASFPQKTGRTAARSTSCSQLWTNSARHSGTIQPTAQPITGLDRLLCITRHYAAAVYYLETAHQIDTSHREIRKSLGYSYVWMGEFSKAFTLVTILPEAEHEMESYVGWWGEQGRPDLAEKASSFAVLLHKQEIP